MPIKQNKQFHNVDGEIVGTGLWIPDERTELASPLTSTLATRVDRQDAIEILEDPSRVPARELFPGDRWIRNQGRRGSCNGYACAWALARARVLRGLPFVPLSGEFVYAGINGGQDRGSMLDDGMRFLAKTGSVPEDMVPHEEYLWRRISEEAKSRADDFLGFELAGVDSEDDLLIGISLGYVAVVAVHFGSRMQRLDRAGIAGSHRGPGNHSVGVDDVRVRNGRVEFDFFNSHGRRYGEDGRAWLTWDAHFAEPNRYHQFFLVRSALDDPGDDQDLPRV